LGGEILFLDKSLFYRKELNKEKWYGLYIAPSVCLFFSFLLSILWITFCLKFGKRVNFRSKEVHTKSSTLFLSENHFSSFQIYVFHCFAIYFTLYGFFSVDQSFLGSKCIVVWLKERGGWVTWSVYVWVSVWVPNLMGKSQKDKWFLLTNFQTFI
jgi:hypothetical protein